MQMKSKYVIEKLDGNTRQNPRDELVRDAHISLIVPKFYCLLLPNITQIARGFR